MARGRFVPGAAALAFATLSLAAQVPSDSDIELVDAGLTPHQALQTATVNAAESCVADATTTCRHC